MRLSAIFFELHQVLVRRYRFAPEFFPCANAPLTREYVRKTNSKGLPFNDARDKSLSPGRTTGYEGGNNKRMMRFL
jgi:hypothetical protein